MDLEAGALLRTASAHGQAACPTSESADSASSKGAEGARPKTRMTRSLPQQDLQSESNYGGSPGLVHELKLMLQVRFEVSVGDAAETCQTKWGASCAEPHKVFGTRLCCPWPAPEHPHRRLQ